MSCEVWYETLSQQPGSKLTQEASRAPCPMTEGFFQARQRSGQPSSPGSPWGVPSFHLCMQTLTHTHPPLLSGFLITPLLFSPHCHPHCSLWLSVSPLLTCPQRLCWIAAVQAPRGRVGEEVVPPLWLLPRAGPRPQLSSPCHSPWCPLAGDAGLGERLPSPFVRRLGVGGWGGKLGASPRVILMFAQV